jgi:hypothetical protein
LPAITFLILASVRFCEIRPIGFSKTTVYSKMFRGKVYTQYLTALLTFIQMILYFSCPGYLNDCSIRPSYNAKYYSLLLIINFISWVIAAKLNSYEYRKRLSESYPHWTFWGLSVLVNSVFLFINFNLYVSKLISKIF